MNTLLDLQTWYFQQCNDDWEHSYGVKIDTLDNPGWLLTIDLTDTTLSDHSFTEYKYGFDDPFDIQSDDWIHCEVENNQFKATGGPFKLDEMINIFLSWSKTIQCRADA